MFGHSTDATQRHESTGLASGDNEAPYVRAKIAQHRRSLELGAHLNVDVRFACPTMTLGPTTARLGPSNGLVAAYLADPFACTFPGGCNLVSAQDVARGHLLIAERGAPGESYLLGSQNMTWRQIHTAIAELAGTAAPRITLNHSLAFLAATADELRAALPRPCRLIHTGTGTNGRALLLVYTRQGRVARLLASSGTRSADRNNLLARCLPPHFAGNEDQHAPLPRYLPVPRRMKTFRSLVVLKRPQPELWLAMRDHMVDFAGDIADIESIRQIERTTDANGIVHVVNEWRVRHQIPPCSAPS